MKKEREFVNMVLEMAKVNRETCEDFCPVAFLVDKNGKLSIIGMPFSGELEKRVCFAALHKMAKDLKAQFIILVVDGWLGAATEEEVQKGTFIRPSKNPDRKEGLIVQVIQPTGIVSTCIIQEYTRVDGKVTWLPLHDGPCEAQQMLMSPWSTVN